ncbi:MAG: RloB domain-containing protein [Methylobacter sp.]
MGRKANSFRRSKPHLKPQPTVLVICEDSKSGKAYLEDSSQHFRIHVLVEIVHCGKTDPKNIVEEGIRRQKEFDHVFCVIDRDRHETFDEAVNLTKTVEKVKIIASYPCYEFWLLLYFGYNRKPYEAAGENSPADMLIKDLHKKPGLEKYEKGKNLSIFNLLKDKLPVARQHAPKVLAEAIATDNMNPSTSLHELIDFFEKLSSPLQIPQMVVLADGKERTVNNIRVTSFCNPDDGSQISALQFMESLLASLSTIFENEAELKQLWSTPNTRAELLQKLAETGFCDEQLLEMKKVIGAEKGDLFDVFAHVAFALPLLSREERAARAKVEIEAKLHSDYKPFIKFVLTHYVQIGIEMLDEKSIAPLLQTLYPVEVPDFMRDAEKIEEVFIDLQKCLYSVNL